MKRNNIYLLIIIIISFLTLSCGGAMQGFRSSSNKVITRAPYYEGSKVKTENIGYFPISFDVRLYRSWLESNRQTAMEPLIGAMNKYLDSLNLGKSLINFRLPKEAAPDIYVGNVSASTSPAQPPEYYNEEDHVMVIYKLNPAKSWKDSLSVLSVTSKCDYYIYITIGFSEYFLHQKNLLGEKELELGTGYTESAKWLSDLDTPAEVLHLTGVLIDKNGKLLRSGSEGIIAKKTGFISSLFDLQEILSEEDITNLLDKERRYDLPNMPLKWQAALNNLVAQLLDKDNLLMVK